MNKPTPPQDAFAAWFKCQKCERVQHYAPDGEFEGLTVEHAEAHGWRWEDKREPSGWRCPWHSTPPEQVALLFFVTVAVGFASVAYKALALAWCWNRVVPTLWSSAPRVQAWQVFVLLLMRALFIPDKQEPDLPPVEILRQQRQVIFLGAVSVSLVWVVAWLMVRAFGV